VVFLDKAHKQVIEFKRESFEEAQPAPCSFRIMGFLGYRITKKRMVWIPITTHLRVQTVDPVVFQLFPKGLGQAKVLICIKL